MRAMFLRDLVLIARRPGMAAAIALHAVVAGAFLLAWRDVASVPFVPGGTIFEQLLSIQWVYVSLAAPWAMCRFIATERGDAWTRLSVLTGVRSSRLLSARLVAAGVYLALLVASALPVVLMAQQIAAVPAARALRELAALFLFALVAGAIAFHVALAVKGRLTAWLISTAAVFALRAEMGQMAGTAAAGTTLALMSATFVLALVLAALLMPVADRSRYLSASACACAREERA